MKIGDKRTQVLKEYGNTLFIGEKWNLNTQELIEGATSGFERWMRSMNVVLVGEIEAEYVNKVDDPEFGPYIKVYGLGWETE